jgi:hypothetical protein
VQSVFVAPDHTQRHSTLGINPLEERSARRRDPCLSPHNTQLCPNEIRTHNSSKQAVADLLLRQRGHWIRCLLYLQIWKLLLYNTTRCCTTLSVAKALAGLWYQERRNRRVFEGKVYKTAFTGNISNGDYMTNGQKNKTNQVCLCKTINFTATFFNISWFVTRGIIQRLFA